MFMNYDFHFHCLPILFVANSIPRRAALSSQKSFFVERPAVLHLSIEKTRKPKPIVPQYGSCWRLLSSVKRGLSSEI